MTPMSPAPTVPVLQAGRNCWIADARLDSAGLLVDARAYFRHFHAAARQARRYILIAGWKFNSEVELLRGPDAEGVSGPVKLMPFLHELCNANPELHIHLLAWNYSMVYIHEWEWFLESKFSSADGRMSFRFDDQHASTGSHHQKFVVIDGTLAYLGGLDFNSDDWDDRDHPPHSAYRINAKGEHYTPYHDVQSVLLGPAAEELTRYFCRRWVASGGEPLTLTTASTKPKVELGLPIRAKQAALSANEPVPESQPQTEPIVQIRTLYTDLIDQAEELIYIENQYLTAEVIGDALVRRMRDARRPRLDIVAVMPNQFTSTIEAAAMEPPRLTMLQTLIETANETGHRLGIYYSATIDAEGVEVTTLIHTKMLIVDDHYLTLGSANMSNRSMGLDSELNVSWEAQAQDQELIESIRRIRVDLLAEHCGFDHQGPLPKELERHQGLVAYLDGVARDPSSRLRFLNRDVIMRDRNWLGPLERLGVSYDPKGP